MNKTNGSTLHPIRVVAQRTGLTTPVLRAWERRYSAVVPVRSDGGQRLYSDDDIRRLQLLAAAVDGGRAIGLIAGLSVPELEELVDHDRLATTSGPVDDTLQKELVAEAFEAVEALESQRLERLLMKAAVELRPFEVVNGLLVPLLQEIGRGWQTGRFGPGSEHMASIAIRHFLEWLSSTIQVHERGPLLITATPAGQRHEFGAHLAGVIAADEGFRVRFLGPDLPAEEIVRAARTLGAAAVAVSAVHPRLDAAGIQEVLNVRTQLPRSVPVMVGGAGAAPHGQRWEEADVLAFDDLTDYRDTLISLRESLA